MKEDKDSLDEMQEGNSTDEEKSEIAVSRRFALIAGILGLGALLIVLIFFRSCTISKVVKSSENVQTVISDQNSSVETTSNDSINSMKNAENSGDLTVSVTAPPVNNSGTKSEETITEDEKVNEDVAKNEVDEAKDYTTDVESEVYSDNRMYVSECGEPKLGSKKTVSATVEGKSILECDSSYIYRVSFSCSSLGEFYYFCPRKTYENLKEGEFADVEYQTDSNGKISVCSVTK